MIDVNDLNRFIEENISEFHRNRIQKLTELRLNSVLSRKNPYLFKAKNMETSEEFVRNILDAFLQSQEETIFGDFLEKLAIYVSQEVYGGRKSSTEGIDLEVRIDNINYLVNIKSGPNWGNASQIAKMVDYFIRAGRSFRTQNPNVQIRNINGCCYGRDDSPEKAQYTKLCGDRFWEFISGEADFYLKIIEPLGFRAREKNQEFNEEYSRTINIFNREFLQEYCLEDGSIDWPKITKVSSQRRRG